MRSSSTRVCPPAQHFEEKEQLASGTHEGSNCSHRFLTEWVRCRAAEAWQTLDAEGVRVLGDVSSGLPCSCWGSGAPHC